MLHRIVKYINLTAINKRENEFRLKTALLILVALYIFIRKRNTLINM